MAAGDDSKKLSRNFSASN